MKISDILGLIGSFVREEINNNNNKLYNYNSRVAQSIVGNGMALSEAARSAVKITKLSTDGKSLVDVNEGSSSKPVYIKNGIPMSIDVASQVIQNSQNLITSGAVYAALQSSGGVDYEEGTWTGSGYNGNDAVTTMSINNARYVKIGKVGFIWCVVEQNSPQNGTLINEIHGLPFVFDTALTNNQIPHGFATFQNPSLPTYSVIPVQLKNNIIRMIGSNYGNDNMGLSYKGIFAIGFIK